MSGRSPGRPAVPLPGVILHQTCVLATTGSRRSPSIRRERAAESGQPPSRARGAAAGDTHLHDGDVEAVHRAHRPAVLQLLRRLRVQLHLLLLLRGRDAEEVVRELADVHLRKQRTGQGGRGRRTHIRARRAGPSAFRGAGPGLTFLAYNTGRQGQGSGLGPLPTRPLLWHGSPLSLCTTPPRSPKHEESESWSQRAGDEGAGMTTWGPGWNRRTAKGTSE